MYTKQAKKLDLFSLSTGLLIADNTKLCLLVKISAKQHIRAGELGEAAAATTAYQPTEYINNKRNQGYFQLPENRRQANQAKPRQQ